MPKTKPKKTKAAKRPAKITTLVVPPIVEPLPIEEVLAQATPIDIPPEAEPDIHLALYAPDEPLEPHAVVVVAAGKKSLFKRLTAWLPI
jgi:hypothetical protein